MSRGGLVIPAAFPEAIRRRARQVRLLLLDVDGVLTDGRLLYDYAGREFKEFHVLDGLGIHWLLRAGIEVGIVSGRTSRAVETRAGELGLTVVFQGIRNKWAVVQNLLEKKEVPADQTAFMGDDLVDFPVLTRVGLAIGVPNGHPLVRRRVDYVTRNPGGRGAVREVAELLLRVQGHWKGILREYQ